MSSPPGVEREVLSVEWSVGDRMDERDPQDREPGVRLKSEGLVCRTQVGPEAICLLLSGDWGEPPSPPRKSCSGHRPMA